MQSNFKKQIDGILSDFGQDRSNLIPILQRAQQKLGYLPEEAMQTIADFLHLSSSTVYSVSTFYTYFKYKLIVNWSLLVYRSDSRAGMLFLMWRCKMKNLTGHGNRDKKKQCIRMNRVKVY